MRAVLLVQATRAIPLPTAKGTGVNVDLKPRDRALAHSRHCRQSTPAVVTAAAASGGLFSSAPAAPPPPPPPPPPPLSSARAAAKFTAAYIILAGFVAIVAPLSVGAALFGKGALAVPWLVRVLGVLAVTFGVYYAGVSSGRGERGFYESTVAGRVALAASFVLLALFGLGDGRSGSAAAATAAAAAAAAATAQKTPRFGLLLLAAANAVGAASMALALRRDDRRNRREEGEEESEAKAKKGV